MRLGFQLLIENRVSSRVHLGLFPSGISLRVWFKVQKGALSQIVKIVLAPSAE